MVRAFGPGVLATDGELDRAKVAELVFSDAAARRRLNSATHLPVLLQIVHQALVHWARCQPVAVRLHELGRTRAGMLAPAAGGCGTAAHSNAVVARGNPTLGRAALAILLCR